ncbi:CU044_2847 family protein [Streptomyces sp. NPDC006393]|uniref:CU044_2847 family protein n=1 Tax=Streptomyces sp. NPDC006393 TaxID=3156763 RepID=UPI0033FFAEA6
MSDLVQAIMPDGSSLWVRAGDEETGPTDTGFGPSVPRRLEDLPQTLETVTRSVRAGLRSAAPDEVSLEFGIELAAKSGHLVSVLTDLGGKATLKVNVTWRKGEEPRPAVTPVPRTDETDDTDDTDGTGVVPDGDAAA